jgi:hypothetical protein
MGWDNLVPIEDKDLHLDRKSFIEIVNSQYSNDNIYVGICELGYCVRARRIIKAGEAVYTFKGETISFEETKTRGIQNACLFNTRTTNILTLSARKIYKPFLRTKYRNKIHLFGRIRGHCDTR